MELEVTLDAPELGVDFLQTELLIEFNGLALPPEAGDIVVVTAGVGGISGAKICRAVNGTASLYNTADGNEPLGISVHAADAGSILRVQTFGPLRIVGWGLTPGARYYASGLGNISTTDGDANESRLVGFALDADTLFIHINEAVRL